MNLRNRQRMNAAILLTGMFVAVSPREIYAQTGTISGFVTDPSGAAVPGARVTAVLVQRNIARTVTTDELGAYLFNALPPGDYRVEAEKTGFQRAVRTALDLSLNQNLRADFTLQLGELAQTVEVTAAAPKKRPRQVRSIQG